MFVVFFLLWIIFNGRVTTEIVLFGLAVSAALYWFICKFMEFGPRKEWAYLKKSGYLLQYLYYLTKEIIKANLRRSGSSVRQAGWWSRRLWSLKFRSRQTPRGFCWQIRLRSRLAQSQLQWRATSLSCTVSTSRWRRELIHRSL